jgi:hypothetical protein
MPQSRWFAPIVALFGLVALPVVADGAAKSSAQRPTLDGQWKARFTTISNRGFASPNVGSTRTRIWLFERRCSGGRCRLVVRRETTIGYVTLKVRRRGGVYSVVWHTRAPCRNGDGTFPYSERITFTVTTSVVRAGKRLASRISGRLIGRSPKGGCQRTAARALDRVRGRRTDLPEPPTASFAEAPERASLAIGPVLVYFTDESRDDGEIVYRAWDFGDPASGAANKASDPNPTHTYTRPGGYRVLLTVTDDEGLTGTTSQLVTVEPLTLGTSRARVTGS